MRTTLLGSVTLLSCALALVAGSARAQDAAPPPAAPPPAAPPAAEAPPPPTAAPAPPPEAPPPPPEAAPPPPPPEAAPPPPAEDAPIPAWIRIDSDITGLQLWAGATHPLGDGIGLASDIYIANGAGPGVLGEFDIGPAIAAGPFTLTPMVGYQVNFADKISNSIVPQLYFIGGPDPIYMEFWFQAYLNSVFLDGAGNDMYMRLFIDYKLGKHFAFGPEIEPWIALNDAGGNRETGVYSFVVGGNIMLTNYGKGSTLLLFLGYETKEAAREAEDGNALGGRFTYVYNF